MYPQPQVELKKFQIFSLSMGHDASRHFNDRNILSITTFQTEGLSYWDSPSVILLFPKFLKKFYSIRF